MSLVLHRERQDFQEQKSQKPLKSFQACIISHMKKQGFSKLLKAKTLSISLRFLALNGILSDG